jgi:hypothetical protein
MMSCAVLPYLVGRMNIGTPGQFELVVITRDSGKATFGSISARKVLAPTQSIAMIQSVGEHDGSMTGS